MATQSEESETLKSERLKLARLRRRTAAAEYIEGRWGIPCSPNTLAKLACIGGGPAFYKAGRVPLYPEPGLDDWAQSKLGPLVRSTSEASAA
jgi:hypothetical protein